MIRPALALVTLVTGACAPQVANFAPLPQPIEVTYETQPCFGTCPVYRVTVGNMGQPGVFEGQRFTAVTGQRSFPLSPRQFDAFYAALAPARAADPADYAFGGARCRMTATDHPGVVVTFHEGGERRASTFRFNYGCRDAQNAPLAAALRRAPTLLPVADLIGRR